MNLLETNLDQILTEIYSYYEITSVEKHNELLIYCNNENKLIAYINYPTKILTVYHRGYTLNIPCADPVGATEEIVPDGLVQLRDSKNELIAEVNYKNGLRHGKAWQIDIITRYEKNFVEDELHGCSASYMVCDDTMYEWDWLDDGSSIKEKVCELLGVTVEYESLTEAEITFIRCSL
jgi:hypothetical protein